MSIKIQRNNKKKWVLTDTEFGTFEFDTATEAQNKLQEFNVKRLREMTGVCQECGNKGLECTCEDIDDMVE